MTPMMLAYEPPRVDDPALRAALIDWFQLHAQSWKRQADGCVVYGAESAANQARARAEVCELFARELERADKVNP